MATDIQGVSNVAPVLPNEGVRAFPAPVPSPVLAAKAPVDDGTSPVNLAAALDDLAARAAESGASLDFRIDEDSGRVVVSVVDRSDGTVLRQMPSEEALRIARSLARFEPHLIEMRA